MGYLAQEIFLWFIVLSFSTFVSIPIFLYSLSLSLYLFPLPSLSHLFFFSSLHTTAAGDAFRRAAELHMGMETKHEAATHFVEAGLVLKREDPKGR